MHLRHTIFGLTILLLPLAASQACRRSVQAVSAEQPPADSIAPKRHASLVFGGDVMAHMPQVTAAKRGSAYDFTESFMYVKAFMDSADVVIVNLETTISETGNYSGYPMFSSPPELAYALKKCGVDIVALANNHICDKGAKGISSTTSVAENAGLKYTGTFADSSAFRKLHPLRFIANGIRFALLSYTYGTNGIPVPKGMAVNVIDTARIAADLQTTKRDSTDVVIIYFHWGIEYMRTPSRQEKELAKWCHDNGADIIIGTHPHVLQRPEEACPDTLVKVREITVYSLGNLVSNQRKRYTDGGMLLRLDITLEDSLPAAIESSYMFTWTYAHWQNGRKHYHILPPQVADTLLKAGTPARAAYDTFITDSRKLFDSLPGFYEIK